MRILSRQASVSCVGLTAPVLILRDASAKLKPAKSREFWPFAMSALAADSANCRRVIAISSPSGYQMSRVVFDTAGFIISQETWNLAGTIR
jgi:hypothetical protein